MKCDYCKLDDEEDDKVVARESGIATHENCDLAMQREIERLRARMRKIVGYIQRIQPDGSPPGFDLEGMVWWIVSETAKRLAESEAKVMELSNEHGSLSCDIRLLAHELADVEDNRPLAEALAAIREKTMELAVNLAQTRRLASESEAKAKLVEGMLSSAEADLARVRADERAARIALTEKELEVERLTREVEYLRRKLDDSDRISVKLRDRAERAEREKGGWQTAAQKSQAQALEALRERDEVKRVLNHVREADRMHAEQEARIEAKREEFLAAHHADDQPAPEPCEGCGGGFATGKQWDPATRSWGTCPSCGGTGKKGGRP